VSVSLDLLSCGAVTPIGLNALQSAAAFRARIAGFEKAIPLEPPRESLVAALIPTQAALRRTPAIWLANLAVRAIRESLAYQSLSERMAIIVALPERVREHPALAGRERIELLHTIVSAVGHRFSHELLSEEGGAGIASGLQLARQLMLKGTADVCLVGGVDSLVNRNDIAKLRIAGRIHEPSNSKGIIPGEGAGFLLVSLADRFPNALARLYGVAVSSESEDVLGPRFSQGRGFHTALQLAMEDSAMSESIVSFRVSNVNGELYSIWEAMFFATRFYRTRREQLPVWYTASSVGEIGAASGAVGIILAALGIAGGYAPGPYAMCENASEAGLRGACLVGPNPRLQAPPFRPEEGASEHILGLLSYQ